MTAEIAHLVGWLQPKDIKLIPGGWTYETYDVDNAWIVQVGRTNYAANTLRHQMRTLPKLAPHLGQKIPTPQLVSEGPTTIVYKKFVGSHADEAPAGAWPEQLGAFLAKLHFLAPANIGLEVLDPEQLRDDARAETRKLLAAVAPRLDREGERERAEKLVAGYVDTASNWHFKPSVIHADLGPENVIVSESGDLLGVIDWEECRTGDPAWDFGWWLEAKPETGKRVLDAYGGAPDDTFRRRAKIAYALMPWEEVLHGEKLGDETMIASGLAGVRERLP